jgi:hypothetical protein
LTVEFGEYHNHSFIGEVHELTCPFCDDILTDLPSLLEQARVKLAHIF